MAFSPYAHPDNRLMAQPTRRLVTAPQVRERVSVSFMFAAAFMILGLTPSLQALLEYSYLRYMFFTFGAWALLVMLNDSKFTIKYLYSQRLKEMLHFMCYVGLAVAYPLLEPGMRNIHDSLGNTFLVSVKLSLIAFSYFMGVYYVSKGGYEYNLLKSIIIVVVSLNALISLWAIFSGELVVREVVNAYQSLEIERPTFAHYALGDLGQYAVYVLMLPVLLERYFITEGTTKFFTVLLIIGLLVCIAMSTLLALQIVASFLIFVSLNRYSNLKASKHQKIMFILFGLLMTASILYSIADTYALGYQRDRILSMTRSSNDAPVLGDTFEKRMMLYRRSIETFLRYPLAGIGGNSITSGNSPIHTVGGHSGILDGLAFYGIFFFIFISFIFVKFKDVVFAISKSSKKIQFHTAKYLVMAYVMLIIADPLHMDLKVNMYFMFMVISIIPTQLQTSQLTIHNGKDPGKPLLVKR